MRILLVEDDARIARFVSQALRESAYAVDISVDGDDALYKAAINDYDAVILDVMIPARDGFAVCRELRAGASHVPILMLSARDATQDRVTGLDAGADDYLTKPFEVTELLARLRALLRRSHVVRPDAITIADVTIDLRSHGVSRAGATIELTAKEYALLEYFARERGRVLSRAEIAEHVWDESYDPLSNIIDVNVNRLRKKLDAGRARSLIHTRRGEGYVMA